MSLRVRTPRGAERAQVTAFLASGGAQDLWMLHCLEVGGLRGFVTAWEDRRLTGIAIARSGAVCAASLTTDESADALGRALAPRAGWRSVVGPERPCARLIRWLSLDGEPRVDRRQVLMTASTSSALAAPHTGLRRARPADEPALAPLVRRYRIEDGLTADGDDDAGWVRGYVQRRIENDLLFVAEENGQIVWTGAFNFIGPSGAGLGGIFTVAELRGRGIGAAATAALCRRALLHTRCVTLHVAETNAAARRCYARAGLTEQGFFRLTFR